MKKLSGYMLMLSFMMTVATYSWADKESDNADALKGLTTTKAVFDITTQNPKKLSFYLNLVKQTAETMQKAGIKHVFVVSFRGPATYYMSKNHDHVKIEDMPIAYKIEEQLNALRKMNHVRLEQCSVAAHALHVDTKSIYPSVKVIGNSWVSLIGYQNKGYALVPVR